MCKNSSGSSKRLRSYCIFCCKSKVTFEVPTTISSERYGRLAPNLGEMPEGAVSIGPLNFFWIPSIFVFFCFISEGWKFFFELGSPVWDYAMRHDGLQTSMTRKVIPWAWIYFSKSRNQNDSLFKSSSLNRQGHMTGKRASICWGRLANINLVMLPTEGSTIMSMMQQWDKRAMVNGCYQQRAVQSYQWCGNETRGQWWVEW